MNNNQTITDKKKFSHESYESAGIPDVDKGEYIESYVYSVKYFRPYGMLLFTTVLWFVLALVFLPIMPFISIPALIFLGLKLRGTKVKQLVTSRTDKKTGAYTKVS